MKSSKKFITFITIITLLCNTSIASNDQLLHNALQANEAFRRSDLYVKGWLAHRDPLTGLIPRNLQNSYYWNAQDAAADNYPFMVLTSFFTDNKLFKGEMLDMLHAEIKYTSRIGACPATFDLHTQTFKDSIADIGNIIFGSAEYMKDGLLPLTEWLGKSPWSKRLLNILDDLKKIIGKDGIVKEIKGNYLGGVQEIEVNGDLLQILSRVYWMTGDKKYLNWAIKIGDFYLLNQDNFIEKMPKIRLRDHGGEIVLGLCELYATLHFTDINKKNRYKPALYRLMDKILECGRNEHGMFYDEINPQNCTIISKHLADTWGYILDGYYTIYLIDKYLPYKNAVLFTLNNLEYYQYHNWEYNSSDGIADAVESAINLYNREPIANVKTWIDNEIKEMFKKQKEDGVIEGWHGDGNFARTAIMYALWKTQGCYINNWNENILIGSDLINDELNVLLYAKESWNGKLFFDTQRHERNLKLPIDWTRINQFPEWFTLDENTTYQICYNNKTYFSKAIVR